MNFAQKEAAIIQKMHDTGYQQFGGNKDKALEFLGSRLESFPDYANVVIREQVMTPIWRAKFDGQEFRDHVQDLDRQRRSAHDSAIMSVNILNRMSQSMGLEPFADIDTNDRYAVADFVGQYVNELYNNGIKGGMDAATLDKRVNYDPKRPHNRLKELDSKFGDIVNQNQNNGMELET